MKKNLIAVIGMALFILGSCVPKTELSVSQSALTFDNKGASQTVSFTANKVWSASSNQSWCKVTPSSGDGSANSSQSFRVSCDPNTTYDSRNCDITIVCEELTALIRVTQAEGSGLIVSQTDYSLTNEAQTVSIEVKSNVDYMVSVEGDATSWIKVQSTKGLSSHTIVLAVSENKDYDTRTGKVTVKDVSGSLSQTITIKQGEAYGLFITKPEYNLSNESHTLTVEVKANVTFDVVPQVDWIQYVETKGLKTSQIVLNIAANDTYDSREGKVVVRQTGGALSETLTIRQDEAFGLIITKTGYGLSCKEQTIDVEVKTNVELEVVIPDDCKDWIVPMGTKGLTASHYTFLVKENGKIVSRGGTITFKQKDGSLSDTVYIKQEGAEPSLTVSPSELKVSCEEQTIDVEVKTNVELEVIVPDDCKDWIAPMGTKGMTTSRYTFLVKENGKTVSRDGTITFKQKDGLLSDTVYIMQEGVEPSLTVSPSELEVSNEAKTYEVTVNANLDYEIDLSAQDWIKAEKSTADESTVLVKVAENTGGLREGIVVFHASDIRAALKVTQTAGVITFADPNVKDICVNNWDTDGDKEISYDEAAAITDLGDAFDGNPEITSFAELRYFTGLKSIAKNAFRGCKSLTAIELPQGLEEISQYAFRESKLASVNFPSSLRKIDTSAFNSCANLASIALPEGLKVLGEAAFNNCTSLTSVVIPESLSQINNGAFRYCSKLERVAIPGGVDTIGAGAFECCTSLTDVSIGEGVKSISYAAFSECTSLRTVSLPKGLTDIGSMAFQQCSSLLSVVIPDSVKKIGSWVFSEDISLTVIKVLAVNPPTGTERMFSNTQCPILVPAASVEIYKQAPGWKVYESRIFAL